MLSFVMACMLLNIESFGRSFLVYILLELQVGDCNI